jgi:hypothetical protein
LSKVLSVAKQQNEMLMSNHSAQPSANIVVPDANANVAEISRNRKWGRGKGKWKGKRGALFKGKRKRKPKGKFGPEKERGDHSREEQGECYRCRAKGHLSRRCRTPEHLVDLYQQSKNKGQHESHFITELEAQKRDDIVVGANDEDVHGWE